MDRAMILGSSRGLGAELAKKACSAGYLTTGIARKEGPLRQIQREHPLFDCRIADLAQPEGQEMVLRCLLERDYAKVFCVAAGGPYAPFGQAGWKDHEWAWEVSFRAHAKVLHALAQSRSSAQVVLIGSSVAENAGDRGGASYAAAKHALKGMHASLRLDYPEWDVRLYSPGYMDTLLLPKNAVVRQGSLYDPIDVANDIWIWCMNADIGGHKVYPPHPL